jgi:predicted GIY-YIG superfamily endonuclease
MKLQNGFWVYAIVSEKDNIIYVGMSTNCDLRLQEHNNGKSKYTSGHLPWRIFYKEYVGEPMIAREREKYFKSAAGKRKLRSILASENPVPGSLPD